MSLNLLNARIAGLERDEENMKSHGTALNCQAKDNRHAKVYMPTATAISTSRSTSRDMSLPPPRDHPGPTSLRELIKILQQTISEKNDNTDEQVSFVREPVQGEEAPLAWWYSRCGHPLDIRMLQKDFLDNFTKHNEAIDIFFTHVNPLYPCLNENWFRTQLKTLQQGKNDYGSADRAQLIALTNLIYSEVQILVRDCTESDRIPALLEFTRADQILSDLTWLGNGNMLTIHCLLVKARYLLYIEKCASAYETMGRVVHLCYRLGLNNQDVWEKASPFDRVMRQRLFWTVFYLERKIALLAGAPYLVQQSDINVDLPPALDDQLMMPDRPLPNEATGNSSVPYLVTAVKWGKLSSEIWDTVFGVHAQRPTSPEYVAATDALIGYTIKQMPAHLQWKNVCHHLNGTGEVNPLIARQSFTLHLACLPSSRKTFHR